MEPNRVRVGPELSSLRCSDKWRALFHQLLNHLPVCNEDFSNTTSLLTARGVSGVEELRNFATLILDSVTRQGKGLIVTDLGWPTHDPDVCGQFLLFLTSMIAEPTSHVGNSYRPLWDIRPRDVMSSPDYLPTYSEHSLPAPLHTDNQFATQPEDLLLLYVVRPANCGGGRNRLLSMRALEEEIRIDEKAQAMLDILTHSSVPFRVPTVFASASGNLGPHQVQWGHVISRCPRIRYRLDTIRAGLALHPAMGNERLLAALSNFADCAEHSANIFEAALPQDSLCIINNHCVLHGRTGFTDRSRHLLRARARLRRVVTLHPEAAGLTLCCS
ncbi:MAG: TauD/TfdA family dioxygenase [Polyangiaceae bacterium]|nr:TauD/TfdA family dioxygenase [Polyangiaceae bacterium]